MTARIELARDDDGHWCTHLRDDVPRDTSQDDPNDDEARAEWGWAR